MWSMKRKKKREGEERRRGEREGKEENKYSAKLQTLITNSSWAVSKLMPKE